jgi:hypothetical protein
MKTFQRRGYGISSQFAVRTTTKKMANWMVGKITGGGDAIG